MSEYQDSIEKQTKSEGWEEGLAEGELKGAADECLKNAKAMLDDGLEVSVIARDSGLTEEDIKSL